MTKKRGRKRVNGLYFGPEQEDAVRRFLKEEDHIIRNKIYNEYLREPLNIMIESIIRKFGLYRKDYSFEDLHADTLSYLIIKADKFNPDLKKRAYSYYGTICKNYMIALIQKDAKLLNKMNDFDTALPKLHQNDKYVYELPESDYQLNDLISNLALEVQSELDGQNLGSKKKINENERKVGEALVYVLSNWEEIFEDQDLSGGSKYNKNSILATIRDFTSLETKDIRIAMKRYKKIYSIVKTSKIENGYL